MRTNKSYFLACICGLMFSPVNAFAQDRLPTMNKLNDNQPIELPLPKKQNQIANSGNPYLEDILQLQYQIGILQSMIQRQANIARLEKSYMELGLFYEAPSPAFGICEQIPANIPCYRAYPDLYEVSLPKMEQVTLPIDKPLTMDMLQGPFLPETKKKEAEAVAEIMPEEILQEPEPNPYSWTEVLCGGGVCSAVIVKDGLASTRKTIQEGDVLENGSIVISSITSDGVKVKREGIEETLNAALSPTLGGPSTPKIEKAAIAVSAPAVPQANSSSNNVISGNTIEDVLEKGGEVVNVNETAVDVSAPSSVDDAPLSDPGPPQITPVQEEPAEEDDGGLGPTGLF